MYKIMQWYFLTKKVKHFQQTYAFREISDLLRFADKMICTMFF